MKYKKSMIILLLAIFIFSIATVNAGDMNDTTSEGIMQMEQVTLKTTENEIITDNQNTFSQLDKDINASHDKFEMKYDYTFSNETDSGPVVINKSNFTINGNNHVLDANMQSGIFKITGSNITINNLVFINGNINRGGAIYATGHITLNNVTFKCNNASYGGAIFSTDQMTLDNAVFINNTARWGGAISYVNKLNCNNSRFIDNYGERGSSIYLDKATLNVCNSSVTSHKSGKYGQIYATHSSVSIDDSDFINITSAYASALYFAYCESSITNSRFINLTAEKSAGAIAIRWSGNSCIKGCEFINTKSIKNAGAILVDYGMEAYNATVTECAFINSSSMMGGAYIQLGGSLFMNNTNFTSNSAVHNGGAVYLAFLENAEIDNCVFDSNAVEDFEDYPGLGGAIFSDYNNILINNSSFLNNSASAGNAILAVDTYYAIANSIFANNTNALFTYYDVGNCIWKNNTFDNEIVITNQTLDYPACVDSPALKFEPVNNTITVVGLPERFDLRDWGWLTPVKDQGRMGACWTFGLTSAVESAILKTYGLELDLSEGNLHHNMLRYFNYGCTYLDEGGFGVVAASYMVGWYGPAFEETDIYDEVGKLSPYITTGSDVIHVQDVIFVSNDKALNGTEIKTAIMKYGALSVGYWATSDDKKGYLNLNTSAQYTFDALEANHEVSVIGWDDNYSKDNFLKTPPGDGAWIIKNSWGTSVGDKGFYYISYYDKTFLADPSIINRGVGIILENTVPYNKNYGYDTVWTGTFLMPDKTDNLTYFNRYEAEDDDLIAAVGTYFNQSGINYTVKIYVNGNLMLTQDGVSPFGGFHTIKLNEYVPVKKGDEFIAEITSNKIPVSVSNEIRVHLSENKSFYIENGVVSDLYPNHVSCLKVYTVEDDSKVTSNTDISVVYGSESYFSVKVVTSNNHSVVGASVEFTINGKAINATTDNEGIAKLEINEVPGNYVVATSYNNQYYLNNVSVMLDLQNCQVVSKNIAVDYAGESYFTAKLVSSDGKVAVGGQSVIFVINGKTLTVKTDKNGMAKIKITEVPNKYTIITIYDGKTYKNTVTVKQVLKVSKVTVKKTARKFTLKATLKINGKLVKGKVIIFKFNGKTYKVKTNSKGIAQKTLKRNVIKKLKKGKTYTVKVTYLKDTIKSSVKVK